MHTTLARMYGQRSVENTGRVSYADVSLYYIYDENQ